MKFFESYRKKDTVVKVRTIEGPVTLEMLRVLVEDTKDWPGEVGMLTGEGCTLSNVEVQWKVDIND